MSNLSHVHHYVPQWYQKVFFGDTQPKFYLQLPTDVQVNSYPRYKSPRKRFCENDLYMLKYKNSQSDVLEKKLFGKIDEIGANSIKQILSTNNVLMPGEVWNDFLEYLDAQLSRTPRALKFFNSYNVQVPNAPLVFMQCVRNIHMAMWADAVWEIFDATDSDIDFLLSDNPVTLYNRAIYPKSKEGQTGLELNFTEIGTQTIFPLNRKQLFVATHIQFARNPKYNPRQQILNPRVSGPGLISMFDIIRCRKMTDTDVIKVNFIIKNRADKYICASNKEFLYPEKMNKRIDWNNIGKNDFLLPDPRDLSFSTQWVIGNDDGFVCGGNEYGQPFDNDKTIVCRDKENTVLQERRLYYDRRYGPLNRLPAYVQNHKDNTYRD